MAASRRNSKSRRSNKTNASKRFGLESLEAREMMAADFMMAPNLAPIGDDGGPVVVGPIVLPDDPVIIDPVFELPPVIPPTLGAKLEGGILTVTGSHDADHIYISAAEGMLKVEEVVKGLTLLSVPVASVNQIVVNANGGDDWVNVDDKSVSIPAILRGDWGNDILMGGAGNDYLYGGSGNDEMLGRGGDDTMYGDHGDDLMVGGDGRDFMYGGYGNDYMVGGDGNDVMMGEAGDDQIFGEGATT
jgi:Ca2+-binding RTX toxin-like protein